MDPDYWDSDESSDTENDIRGIEVTNSPLQEDLLPLLECPVCFDLPLPPILTCYQGHIICANCCPKLISKKCPLCQKPIGYGRNFFAEDYINKSTMKCKYRADGCDVVFTGAQAKAHIPQCNFRPLKCLHCAKRIAFNEFEKHLWSDHKISQWDISEENGIKIYEAEKQRRPAAGAQFNPAITNSITSSILLIGALAAFSFLTDNAVEYLFGMQT